MPRKFVNLIKPLFKTLVIFSLVATLVLGNASNAMAAVRGGGRIGGGSFRAPAPTRVAPRPSSPGGYGGGYGYGYPGGGFGFPFIMPIFGIGGGFGGLFTILLFLSLASFLVRSFRNATAESSDELGYTSNPKVSVAKVQVGLLADARELQADLNNLAEKANTSTAAGLSQVLQESTLALMRHPEYWAYGGSTSSKIALNSAEAQFNRLALAERSKFSGETLSNVNSQVKRAAIAVSDGGEQALAETQPGEYIVATLLVATQGDLQLPAINSEADMRRALTQLGSVSSDRLLALEVLWTPQAEGETMSSEEVLANYPELRLI
ncbi:DUF1517 domain-containing protein [Leptolyngbya sp. AN02str]|uniref:DUF1517 domain-containing protein n=1 Tax=Leptolyngbya sp. AN02str TaxID=3423363 RepID=UPI003D315ED4